MKELENLLEKEEPKNEQIKKVTIEDVYNKMTEMVELLNSINTETTSENETETDTEKENEENEVNDNEC